MTLQIKNIEKSFGQNRVLRGVNLDVKPGCAMGVLGRNGAGKTTLMRIIMQVFAADRGSVEVDSKEISLVRPRVGYLPEERGMYPKKTVIDQLIYFGSLTGLSRANAKANALKLLDRLEMKEYTNKKLLTLSKGNQQKIQLAVTLIADPEIVVLDEPFSGLDPVNAMLLKELVKEIIGSGRIVIFSSHQMNYIEEFCSEIAILNEGVVAVSGSIRDIRRSYGRRKFTVSTDDPRALINSLRESLGDGITDAQAQGQGALITLAHDDLKRELFAAVAAADCDFDAVSVFEPTLNDIFVEHTTKEERK